MKLSIKLAYFCIAQFAAVTSILVLGLAAYVLCDLGQNNKLPGVFRLLDVGVEQSIPTYFSALNLLLSSILILVIYGHAKIRSQRDSVYWLLLSALFLFLSLDEFASIHEMFERVYDYLVQRQLFPPLLETHKWLPFGVLFVSAVAIGFFPFLRNLPKDTLRYFLISGCVFLVGALGFEFLGALMLKAGVVDSRGDIVYLLRRILEEGFEMYGIALFNCALYREISVRRISLVLVPSPVDKGFRGSRAAKHVNNTATFKTNLS